jgi:tRNA 2-thiocytidine biosynthesis protein TtcA
MRPRPVELARAMPDTSASASRPVPTAEAAALPATRGDPRKAEFEANKLRKRLRRQVGEAIGAYALVEPHDRVMVCVSGGKDSHGLLDILLRLKERAPFPFEVVAMNLDQKQPGHPADVLPRYLEARGVPFRIVEQDTYSVVKRVIPEGGTLCSLCSRLRRGVIYRVAAEIGATKIALGHHRDDILATFFLNLFFGGKLKTMPPKLVSDDGRHVVIRPLAYVRERDLARYAEVNAFPIIPCNLCGSQEHLQRRQVAAMLRDWEKKYPGRTDSIFGALGNVVPSHLLDRALFDFAAVRPTGRDEPDGDLAFDVDPALERATDLAAAARGFGIDASGIRRTPEAKPR